jgi:cytidine deaminase
MSRRNKQIEINYAEIDSSADLSDNHVELLLKAKMASQLAYAPYSRFNVGAAARLDNGKLLTGSNKENASFPAGICAERNVLNYISDLHPDSRIMTIAVYADPKDFQLDEPVSPCGICRQVLAETEQLQQNDIEIVISSGTGNVLIFSSAKSILPFHFYLSELRR